MLGGGGVALGIIMAFTSLTASAATATCLVVSTIVTIAVASDADTIAPTNVTAAGDATASDAANDEQNVDWLRGQQLRQRKHLSERQVVNFEACSILKASDFFRCKDTE